MRGDRVPAAKYDDQTHGLLFSELKTAVARWVEARQAAGLSAPVADVAATFEEAVVDAPTRKAVQARREERRDHR